MISQQNSNMAVTRSSMPDFGEYVDEIRSIFEGRWLTNMGPKHQELEMRLADYLGVPFVSLFTNGHTALEYVLQAFELEGEVITTPFTFVSTTNAIVRSGLTPVFCDIKDDDLTIDPAQIEDLITDKTCAIVPVHVYGSVCDVDAIDRIARKNNLKVIYDAAHAFGVKIGDRGVGTFGDAAMFSFHATKVFHTIEGGAVVAHDDELIQKLAKLKNFGIVSSEEVDCIGGNAKMNEFSAAMGLCNLRHIDEYLAGRKAASDRYRERLRDVPGIRLLRPQENVSRNYAYFPVLIEDSFGLSRDELFDRLLEQGVGSRKYFYPLTSDFACYQSLGSSMHTPKARDAAARVLALPLHSELLPSEVDVICDAINNIGLSFGAAGC